MKKTKRTATAKALPAPDLTPAPSKHLLVGSSDFKSNPVKFPDLKKANFRPIWFEDAEGNRFFADERQLPDGQPPIKYYPYMVSLDSCEIVESHFDRKAKDSGKLAACRRTANPELVRALTDYIDPHHRDKQAMRKALIIAATACERCMNILAHQCRLDWGYAATSAEAQHAQTRCELCS